MICFHINNLDFTSHSDIRNLDCNNHHSCEHCKFDTVAYRSRRSIADL